MKFLNYPECRYETASMTSGAISKHEAVFGDCRSEQQIFSCFIFISSNFYWPHILKGRVDGMHLQSHLLIRRRFSRFSDGIWQDMIRKVIKLYRSTELLLWVPWSIHGGNKSRISRTHTGQFLVLGDFFLLKKVPVDWRGRTVFFFFVTTKHSRHKT